MAPFVIENRQKTIFIVSLILAVTFLSIFLGIIITDNQYDDWVYASAIFSMLLFIGAVPVFIIYKRRSDYLERIRSGDELYKQWSCSDEEWSKYLEVKKKLKKGANKGLYITMVIIGLIIGIGLSVMGEDILFFYITAGIVLFLSIPAFLFPVIDHMMMPAKGNIALAKNAVYISGRLYNWNMATSKLAEVSLVEEEGITLLCFVYTYITLTIIGMDTVYVPLTENMLKEADEIVNYYKPQIK